MGVSKWLAFGSVPGLGRRRRAGRRTCTTRYGDGFNTTLLWIVAGALLFTVAFSSLGARAVHASSRASATRCRSTRAIKVAARRRSALVLGFILGMTSVGSGALVGLALILVFRLTPHRVVGTDVFHAAIMLWAAGLAHLLVGNIDSALMGTILDRLAARRLDRRAPAAARPRGGAAAGARLRDARLGARRASEGRRRPPPG